MTAQKQTNRLTIFATGISGALASFLTQPLEVIKTNRINSPSLLYLDLHKMIVRRGWKSYMRGSSLAVVRQAFGFSVYMQFLNYYERYLLQNFAGLNKYVSYSFSAVSAKLIAMIFEAPLTLLKTRVEKLGQATIMDEIRVILNNPIKQSTKGLGSSIARESMYTLFHYTTYRYIKDSIFLETYGVKTTFVPAFVAGVVAITVSQPFEVIRNQVSLHNLKESFMHFLKRYYRKHGARGFFFGFVPRLVRKPINSGISWSLYEYILHSY